MTPNPDQTELLDPPAADDIQTFQKVLELERELKMRRQVYPRLIAKHRISKDEADRRILIHESILEDYKRLMAREAAGQMPDIPE